MRFFQGDIVYLVLWDIFEFYAIVNSNQEFFNIIRDIPSPDMGKADYVMCVHPSAELFTGYIILVL